jgi:beta-N-acetylhexosaminidase
VTVDSHYDLPVVPDSREEIEETLLRPFRAAIEAEVGAIMTAHALYTALDPDLPATLSPKILRGLLRQEMGFEGLILTDALDMGAVTNERSDREIIEQAMNAGVDMLLLGHLMNRNQLPLISIAQPLLNPASVARIRAAQARVGQTMPSLDVVGSREHQKIVAEIAQKAITLARDTESLLPLRLSPDAHIAVVTAQPVNLTPADTTAQITIGLADAIRQRHHGVKALEIPHQAADADIPALVDAVRDADIIVVGTLAADADPAQQAFITAVQQLDRPVIVVALRTPYEVAALPHVGTVLCTYSPSPASVEAAAMVLFGELTATGHLPIKL